MRHAGLALDPIERQLSAAAAKLLRQVRITMRRFLRIMRWAGRRWAEWTYGAVLFTLLALLAPLFDRALLATLRRNGLLAFAVSLTLSLAVYLRLLFDSRTPTIGKLLLLFAVVYGVSPGDLLPDRLPGFGLVDDVAVVVLASRSLVRLCPNFVVEEHARRAARAWKRSMRRRWLARGSPARSK